MNKEEIALTKTLHRVLLEIRMLGYEGQKSGLSKDECELIADLADAVHNIPEALISEKYDLNFHTEIMLGGFDEKYKEAQCIKPLEIYKNALNENANKL
ncbi:hypothetical protein [Pseudoalteromonas luteoviolacea]|uniref:hypothetical protein n=1 Tax=Pseudoalteromonas luteoviolacea TaxID=43657 RepID=UPI00114F72DA|nr:hypothetical protein [Pseudoalteromonas luteoviolacea]TQF70132.1 hypothetical protein FLM44_03295 [Pseudoalteromonas luteoviolacea]